MGLKRAESQLQILLADTIWAMCKNTLAFKGGIRVEGLIGVTIDEEEIFLIPVNQKISKEVPNEVAIVEAEQSTMPAEYKTKRKNEPQNYSNTSDNSSESSESDSSEVSDSECDKERKKRSRKRKRRRRPSGAEISSDFQRSVVESGTKNCQPVPDESNFYSAEAQESEENMSPPARYGPMMVIKPETGHDDQDSHGEAAEDLVIVKSEFGSRRPPKPGSQNTNKWHVSGGPLEQQVAPNAHQSPFQGNSFVTEVQGGHAAAILQHLSSIQNMASMQYSAQGPMSMCAQSPQHFMNQSRPQSFDGHSQPSSSQSPVAQNVGEHVQNNFSGEAFHLTRKRTSFSPRQISALEQAFNQHGHYMNAHDRAVFARSIGLTEKIVTIWFQNRRQKLKKSDRQGPMNTPPM